LNETETIALIITTAINAPASGVSNPSASSVPPPASASPAMTAINTPARKPREAKNCPVPCGP
jgi:hypothetical protein